MNTNASADCTDLILDIEFLYSIWTDGHLTASLFGLKANDALTGDSRRNTDGLIQAKQIYEDLIRKGCSPAIARLITLSTISISGIEVSNFTESLMEACAAALPALTTEEAI